MQPDPITKGETLVFVNSAAQRLDKALAALCPALSRARLQALIKEGAVTVNGASGLSAAHALKGGEELRLIVPPAKPAAPQAKNIPLAIVYEDADVLVIDKQAGLVVHPAAGHEDDTLVNALLAHCGDTLSGIGGEKRPGIVHRLDKDTSGLMVVAKNDAAHHGLAAQFFGTEGEDAEGDESNDSAAASGKTLTRRYSAFAWGLPKSRHGTVDTRMGRATQNRKKMAVIPAMHEKYIDGQFYGYRAEPERKPPGKQAITHYTVEQTYGGLAAQFACVLETGRTHQIRVHLAHLGHSVIGDPLYGRATGMKNHAALQRLAPGARDVILDFPRQALHAAGSNFIHPRTREAMQFESPLPEDMEKLKAALSLI